MEKNKRPLIWSNGLASQMLIDPISNIAGGRITDRDKKFFQRNWAQRLPWIIFTAMVPRHLKFHWLSYDTKHFCEDAEKDTNNMIMGVDGDNNCIYWVADAKPKGWELLIDGTCEPSYSERAIYASKAECASHTGFECVTVINNGTTTGYCQPGFALGAFHRIDDCEANCHKQSILV